MNEDIGKYFSGSKNLEKELLILTEGRDDMFFLDSILGALKADPMRVGVVSTGGKDGLAADLKNIVQSRPFVNKTIRRIAIVQDVDGSPSESLRSIHKAMSNVSLPNPKHADVHIFDGNRSVGVFLIPSGNTAGNLESFCLQSVATSEVSMRVHRFFEEFQNEFGELDRQAKRLAQIYLACIPVECRGVGRAARLGVFPIESEFFSEILNFFRRFLA